eukprot:scaffold131500_cov32-Attheya_sp.AAC.2
MVVTDKLTGKVCIENHSCNTIKGPKLSITTRDEYKGSSAKRGRPDRQTDSYIFVIICPGIFCDRQLKISATEPCGCLYTNAGQYSSMVLKTNVLIPVPANIKSEQRIYMAELWIMFSIAIEMPLTKWQLSLMNMVVGLSLVGFVKDWSATLPNQQEKIESQEISMHITLLVPSDVSKSTVTEEFKALRISLPDIPVVADANEQNALAPVL